MGGHSTALRLGALCVICCIFVITGVEAFRNLQGIERSVSLHDGIVGEGDVIEAAAAPASTKESVQSATAQKEQDQALATCKATYKTLCYPSCSKIARCKVCHKAGSSYFCDRCLDGSFLAPNKKSCTQCRTGSYGGGKLKCRHAHAIFHVAMLYTFPPHTPVPRPATQGPIDDGLSYLVQLCR